MKKFVMALSILAMGGSALVGVLNKKDLETEIEDLGIAEVGIQETSTELSQTEDELADEKRNEMNARNERDMVAAQVSETDRTLSRLTGEISNVDSDLKMIQVELDEITIAIRKVFPTGEIKSSDEFRTEREAVRQEKQGLENTKSELTASLASVQAQRMNEETRVKSGEATQVKRAQRIALNGLEATVIAVNRDWGFVMINAGKNFGVTEQDSLLIKRGNERVARLRIVDLSDTAVVCSVVKESLADGVKINPGDKVIFENTKS